MPSGQRQPSGAAMRLLSGVAGPVLTRWRPPEHAFRSADYIRHNQRRLEHLATLGLPLSGVSVLEIGAGVGDHTTFFLDRGCTVTVTDGRSRNVAALRARFPHLQVDILDLDAPPTSTASERHEVTYCYGVLYHLARPAQAIAYLAAHTSSMLLLETCVSYGEEPTLNPVPEARWNPSQAVSGQGCRPTRRWVWEHLERHFEYVYTTATQPRHEQFPLDWCADRAPTDPGALTRAVFVASREPLEAPALLPSLPVTQSPCP